MRYAHLFLLLVRYLFTWCLRCSASDSRRYFRQVRRRLVPPALADELCKWNVYLSLGNSCAGLATLIILASFLHCPSNESWVGPLDGAAGPRGCRSGIIFFITFSCKQKRQKGKWNEKITWRERAKKKMDTNPFAWKPHTHRLVGRARELIHGDATCFE